MTSSLCLFALVGCGFHPVGSSGELPKVMHTTYVASGEPYGNLENLLRRAVVARGDQVTEDNQQASAVLDIMSTDNSRRVLAVNSNGQPLEYSISYRVQFRLLDAKGKELLTPQSVVLHRNLAYSIYIQIGSTRRERELVADMQGEAVQLILLRLEALRRDEAADGSHTQ
ncbi:MAG: LPS assembly lipoprotein LptE [Gammaproteobacteria bacterium]